MMPRITMRTGHSAAEVPSRTIGALTGSRTAGAMGGVVMRDMLNAVTAGHRALGFTTRPEHTLVLATYVDKT